MVLSMRRSLGKSSSVRRNAASLGPVGREAVAVHRYVLKNCRGVICSTPSPSPSYSA